MNPVRRKRTVSPGVLTAVFATLSVLMVTSAFVERHQSRAELRALMGAQAHTLLESLVVASDNALLAGDRVELLLRRRLLDQASFVRTQYEQGRVTDSLLARWGRAHGLHRIHIIAPDGRMRFANHPLVHIDSSNHAPADALLPIFEGAADTLILGLRTPRFGTGYRYATALAARDRSAVVVNLDAEALLAFRRNVGFGPLLRRVAEHPGILYVAVQDTAGLLAGAGRVDLLEAFDEAPFLQAAWADTSLDACERIVRYDTLEALEVVHPFYYRGEPVGLFRLGLSVAPLDALEARITRRLGVITVVILAAGFVVLAFVVARQNADLLARQVEAVDTFSRRVIEHVSDGIVVFDEASVQAINRAAQELFERREVEVLGRPVTELLAGPQAAAFLASPARREHVEVPRDDGAVHLLVSRSTFEDEHGRTHTILILRDLTRQKQLEARLARRERATALGELAGALAHEIRNPLNAVATVVQQLRSDFQPADDAEGYRELTGLVYQEVRRINDAVQRFLHAVRPAPPRPELFPLADLVHFVARAYAPLLAERGVHLEVTGAGAGEVYWDREQMQQVLMNLVENARDAVDAHGHVAIEVASPDDDTVELRVRDDGCGISETVRGRIFNLYFTTKPRGTGIGLSLVQRIVHDHGGTIDVDSREGEGSTFTVRLPRWAGRMEYSA